MEEIVIAVSTPETEDIKPLNIDEHGKSDSCVKDDDDDVMECVDGAEAKPSAVVDGVTSTADETSPVPGPPCIPSSSARTCAAIIGIPASDYETFLTERKLIDLVRKQPALFDSKHRRFSDDAHKEQLWQAIARKVPLDFTKCLSTWAELRYKYQRHVRRLRNFLRRAPRRASRAGATARRKERPIMVHENDLIFLYKHVAQYEQRSSQAVESMDVDQTAINVSDVMPGQRADADAVTDIIDLDQFEGDDVHSFRLTEDMRSLIECVQAYSQLYDTRHSSFANYRHRGAIWGAISNELKDKATRLMKNWLQLQTRYEWELFHSSSTTQLQELLGFLKPHIKDTRGTVYKSSFYLRESWHDPIDQFRSVMILINVLKGQSELCQLTEDFIDGKMKPARYHELWRRVANTVNCTQQRCEVTWLVLRKFYFELAEMRKVGYQLQDKWFFENGIGNLYKTLIKRSLKRPKYIVESNSGSSGPASPTTSIVPSPRTRTPSPPPRLPLAIVYPPAAAAINSSPANSSSNSSTSSFSLPRITAAISVVSTPPKPMVLTPPTKQQPTPTPASTATPVTIMPKPPTLQLTTRPTVLSAAAPSPGAAVPATIQLAGGSTLSSTTSAPKLPYMPRPPTRPIVQLTLLPKARHPTAATTSAP